MGDFSNQFQQFTPDTKDLLGPTYDYSAEINTPGDVGVHFGDGSIDGIMGGVTGVNYYSDIIGYGETEGLAQGAGLRLTPMGLRFFIKSGATCSNGQDMYEYVDTLPHGIPGRLGNEIESTLGVHLRGLAPGIFEDAGKALNPAPMFNSMMNSGYARCRKVTLPVGDAEGNIRSKITGEFWIDPSTERIVSGADGKPAASHWIFDSWVSADQYAADQKVEGFRSGLSQSKLVAGALFAALFIGLVAFTSHK